MFYYDWTMLLVIPGLLLGLWAQFRVQSTFSKYGSVLSSNGQSADRIARLLLNRAGCDAVDIEQTSGSLTDHYDPRTNVLRLSSSVVGSTSVAAIGVAAHECGHAMQQRESYGPLKLRCIFPSSSWDCCSAGSRLFMWESRAFPLRSCFHLSPFRLSSTQAPELLLHCAKGDT